MALSTGVRPRPPSRPDALTMHRMACGASAAPRGPRTDPYAVVRLLALAVVAPAVVVAAGGTVTAACAFAALVVLLDRIAGRHHAILPSALDEMPALALGTLAATAIVLTAGLSMSATSVDRSEFTALGSMLGPMGPMLGPMLVAAACVTLTGAARAAGYAWIRRLRRQGRAGERTVVVGASGVGTRLVTLLQQHPEYGLRPVGLVDSGNGSVPVIGRMADLPLLVTRHRIRRVIVAFPTMSDGELVQALRGCERLDCEIYVVPRLFELASSGSTETEHLWGLPCVRLPRAPFRAPAWRVKRIIDVTAAAAGLLALAPLLLLVAVAVRLEIGPGVLFRQERTGLDGRVFSLVKFRSLRPAPGDRPPAPDDRRTPSGDPRPANADPRPAANGDPRPAPGDLGWSVVADDRMGPVGRFLRRTSLDELPQLWNVLMGHMSLVGPRPEQPRYVELFAEANPDYADRLRAPAGVTGLAQVVGLRGNTSIEERVRFDNFYIEHWSLWGDIKIMLRTIASVLLMRGA
jgi:exopolysaccharide biosynthesis polyprenyl glycosylphosphotransferase